MFCLILGDPGQRYSFSKVLADYEYWVQNVSMRTPWIECKNQDSFMSEYMFETDKVEDAPRTRGDEGEGEEVCKLSSGRSRMNYDKHSLKL